MSSRVQAIRSGGYQIDFKFSPRQVDGETIYIVVASLTKEKNAIGRAETFYGISLYEDTGKQIKGSKWWRWRYLMSGDSFKLWGQGERDLLCRAFSHAWREGGVAGDKTEALGKIETLLGRRNTSRIFSKKALKSQEQQISARRDALLEVFLTVASVRLDPARSAGVHSVLEILRGIIEIVDKYIPAEDWEKHLRKVLKRDSRPLSVNDLTGIDERFAEYEEREHAEKESELKIFAQGDPDKQKWIWKARDEVPGKKQWLDNLNELRSNNQSAATYQYKATVTRQILAHGTKSRKTERIKCMPKAWNMLESQEHVKIWFGLVAQASDVQEYTHFTDYLTAMTLDEKVEFANREGAPAVNQMVMEDKRDEEQLQQRAEELSGKVDERESEALERAFEEGEVMSAEELRRLGFSALDRMAHKRGIAQSAINEAMNAMDWKAALVALLVASARPEQEQEEELGERVKQESSPEESSGRGQGPAEVQKWREQQRLDRLQAEQQGAWGKGGGGGRILSKKRIRKSTKRKKRKKIKNTKRKNTRRNKRRDTKRKNTKRKNTKRILK